MIMIIIYHGDCGLGSYFDRFDADLSSKTNKTKKLMSSGKTQCDTQL